MIQSLIRSIKIVFVALALGLVAYVFVAYYPYIFSKDVDGVLQKVERVQLNVALMQSGADSQVNPQLFSFAVGIRTDNGEIMTASAEDRQWAAAQPGNCVTSRFYPYPPWRFDKAGTYYNARLDRQYECPERAAKAGIHSPVSATPPSQPAVPAAAPVPAVSGTGAPTATPQH